MLCVNNLDEHVNGKIRKFANNTKIVSMVDCDEGCLRLYQDSDLNWERRQRSGLWNLLRQMHSDPFREVEPDHYLHSEWQSTQVD